MRQYDVYLNPRSGSDAPYLVVLQSDLMRFRTVIVAPLVPPRGDGARFKAEPPVEIDGELFVLALPELAAIDRRLLKSSIGSLDDLHDTIRPAIDLLFNGV